MATTLPDLLESRHVKLALRSRSAENAIQELIELLAPDEHVAEPEKFAEQVIAREQANPSAVEDGVAFPHARTDSVEKIVLMIGRSRSGVPFGKLGLRANLIFLIGVPQRLVSDYLVCVGALARIARIDTIRADLLRVKTADDFINVLRVASSPEGTA
jgi:mannitol/fructose-specific phosphotransferase system IIA component (Ntr-type)